MDRMRIHAWSSSLNNSIRFTFELTNIQTYLSIIVSNLKSLFTCFFSVFYDICGCPTRTFVVKCRPFYLFWLLFHVTSLVPSLERIKLNPNHTFCPKGSNLCSILRIVSGIGLLPLDRMCGLGHFSLLHFYHVIYHYEFYLRIEVWV